MSGPFWAYLCWRRKRKSASQRMCGRKVKYLYEGDAHNRLLDMQTRADVWKPETLIIYICPRCTYMHIGHAKA